ncbi:MAG: hypothetical protein ACK4M7_06405, partial [Burkholderiales bacterium]
MMLSNLLKKAILCSDFETIKQHYTSERIIKIENFSRLQTILEFASHKGKIDVIKFILENHYDSLAFDSSHHKNFSLVNSILGRAALKGHLPVTTYLVNYILSTFGKDTLILLLKDRALNMGLETAAFHNNFEIVIYWNQLIETYLTDPFEIKNIRGKALIQAIKNHHPRIVTFFFEDIENASQSTVPPLTEKSLPYLQWGPASVLFSAMQTKWFALADRIVTLFTKTLNQPDILARQLISLSGLLHGSIYNVYAAEWEVVDYMLTIAPSQKSREGLIRITCAHRLSEAEKKELLERATLAATLHEALAVSGCTYSEFKQAMIRLTKCAEIAKNFLQV